MTDDPRVEAAAAAARAELRRLVGESDKAESVPALQWVNNREDIISQAVARAALAAADKAAWRPISEAPKDGTPVLIWGPATSHALGPVEHHAPTVCVAAFRGGLWAGVGVSYLNWHPTHFMPLPAPPSDD